MLVNQKDKNLGFLNQIKLVNLEAKLYHFLKITKMQTHFQNLWLGDVQVSFWRECFYLEKHSIITYAYSYSLSGLAKTPINHIDGN